MKVLMPIGDGTEVMDTLYPFFRLPEFIRMLQSAARQDRDRSTR